MALSLQEVEQHINHALGGPLVGIDQRRIYDEAGRKLLRAREWNFTKRPPTTLGIVASQSYVTLPADFGSIVTIHNTSGIPDWVHQTTLDIIGEYRSNGVGIPGGYLFVSPVFSPNADGVPTPRLEVFPTPTTTDASALTLYYRVRWPDLVVAGENYIPVPEWLEDIYLAFLRATAWGYQDDSMEERIARIKLGSDWADAIRFDAEIQYEHGPMRSGALAMADDGPWEWYLRNAAAAPAAG